MVASSETLPGSCSGASPLSPNCPPLERRYAACMGVGACAGVGGVWCVWCVERRMGRVCITAD